MKGVCFIAFLSFGVLSSCTRSVCPPNPVFESRKPGSPEYNAEFVRQIRTVDLTELSYYIDTYSERENKQYLQVGIHGDELCAFVTMDITDCAKLWHVKEKKGKGYGGAGLIDPKFIIDSSTKEYRFILQDISRIRD